MIAIRHSTWRIAILISSFSFTAILSYTLGWGLRLQTQSSIEGLNELDGSYGDFKNEAKRYCEMKAVHPAQSCSLVCQEIIQDLAHRKYDLEVARDIFSVNHVLLSDDARDSFIQRDSLDERVDQVRLAVEPYSLYEKMLGKIVFSCGVSGLKVLPHYLRERREVATLEGYYEKAIEYRRRLLASADSSSGSRVFEKGVAASKRP